MDFDVNKLFQDRLASSIGLDKYQYIMQKVRKINVSSNVEFQKTFNTFYKVRRNEEWRKIYYEFFEQVKTETPTFAEIITYLYETTGYVEASFSSKMLATLCSEKPIWDKHVIRNLNMKLSGKNCKEKLENAIAIYADIENWYKDFFKTDKAKECIRTFDQTLPDYSGISDIKKIDSILLIIK